MADIFKEIIPSILQTKKNALLTDADERAYNAFIVGRAMSYHRDTVALANEINQYPNIDNKLKYEFLLNSIKPYKRQYATWHKRAMTADLDVVKEYYGYSDAKAIDALRVLSSNQINELRTRIDKGD